ISATAGTAETGGDGGNVQINNPNGFVIAVPNENSDIIANAFSGTGGNIDITTQNIIGLDAARATAGNTTNDIDASSQFGSDGTIVLNNLDLDPAQGLVELPANTAEPRQVAQRCAVDSGQQSAFVITGQGGTPPSPREVMRNAATGLVDLGSGLSGQSGATEQTMERPVEQAIAPASDNRTTPQTPETLLVEPSPVEAPLIEAQTWQKDVQGNVVLVARSTDWQPENNPPTPICTH
ncbi:MAG: S-layer family protein, partial [Cyanobacteria bacterium J06598_3]